ncbi:UNVERIFIED_CONTAM: hypothetical protein K2H54_061107 [Gekko kuhli]
MAARGPTPAQELCEELSCPICLDYFRDPVSIVDCGHNFCRACLTRSWGEAGAGASCPVCKRPAWERNLMPNRQLANVVEIAKKLSPQGGREGEAKGTVCEQHQETLKLFCKDDEAPICVVCDRSKEHRDHRVIPAEEAAQEYQNKFCRCLGLLRKEREEILAHQVDLVGKSQDLLSQTEVERQKMVAEFRKMHRFLEEQEKLLLVQVEEVKKVIAEERDEQLARLSKEISYLGSLIREVEEKTEQPVAEFLQDARSSLQRYEEKEKFRNPVTFTSKLKWRIWELCTRNRSLEVNLKLFRDTLPSQLQVQKAINVILDPITANPCLILSENQKSVRWESKAQELPKNPERFYNYPIVLGCEGFMEGCHFWEISVGSKNGWSVGVAKKSVNRKGLLTFSPEGGIWALGNYGNKYYGLTHPPYPLSFLSGELKRIRVCLNYPERRVAFFDGDRDILLYEFSGASFQGETLFPFFQVFRNGLISLPLYANKSFD